MQLNIFWIYIQLLKVTKVSVFCFYYHFLFCKLMGIFFVIVVILGIILKSFLKRIAPWSASVCYSHSLIRKHSKYLGTHSGEACRPWRHLHLLAHQMAVWGRFPTAECFPTSEQLNNLVSYFADKTPTDIVCIWVYHCVNTNTKGTY